MIYLRFDLVTDGGVEGWGWYIDNISYSMSVNTTDIVSPIRELKLFPNPATENTTVSFQLEKTALTNMVIYDMQGKLIQNEKVGKLSTGLHQIPIALDKLNTGNYILQLTTGASKKSIKFSKI